MWFLDVYLIRNLLADFDSSCSHLHPHKECRRVPFCLHPLQPVFSVHVLDGVMLTCGRGFLMWALICVDLVHSGMLQAMGLQRVGHDWATDLHSELQEFSLYFLILNRVTGLLLEILFLKGGPVWIHVWWFIPGHDWTGEVIYSPADLVNMKSPTALGLKSFFWKMALRKQHCFLPHSGPQALSLMENSVHGLSARVDCARRNTQGLNLFSFPLTQCPQDTSQFFGTPLCRGCCQL